mgnify:FL=1
MAHSAKPIALKLIEGNRGHQTLNRNFPKFEKGFGRCPVGFGTIAKRIWHELAPQLEAAGLDAQTYRSALEGLCVAYQQAKIADKFIAKNGQTYISKSGSPCTRPEIIISRDCWRTVRSFCQDFGITPGSQGKIVVPKPRGKSLKEQCK